MAITSTNSIDRIHTTDKVSNPNAVMDKDAFMKLFLVELSHQDPTSPMETEKMMEQTSQLSAMETNQNLQKSLDALNKRLSSANQFTTISAIGKMGDTGQDGLSIKDAKNVGDINFDLYFKDDISSGTLKIMDMNGDVVRTVDLDSQEGGLKSFSWDGKDDNGKYVADGVYAITAEYKNSDKEDLTTKLGVYPIESVRFDNGVAQLKMGNKYYSLNDIKEIY